MQIDDILETFPYTHYQDQEQRLARLLIQWPENVNTASKRSGINKRTMQQVRASWNDLSNTEQARLLTHLSRIASTQLQTKATQNRSYVELRKGPVVTLNQP